MSPRQLALAAALISLTLWGCTKQGPPEGAPTSQGTEVMQPTEAGTEAAGIAAEEDKAARGGH